MGDQSTSPTAWTAGPTACDPGTLDLKSVFDTMNRTAAFRWFVGEAPAPFKVDSVANDEAGALLCAFNPPGTVPDPHAPPMSAKCWTQAGASIVGSSDLAWGGGGPLHSIDLWFEDNGNETTFGHRRWLMNPPLGPVTVGYADGGPYGGCTSMTVFDGSTPVPDPEPYYSWPPAGYVPIEYAMENWTLHGPSGAGLSMVVHDASNPTKDLEMTANALTDGYGELHTTFFARSGWDPKVGETYTVDVSNASSGAISYTVMPINCN